MNMPINKQALEDAAAMANIPNSLNDIYSMIEGRLKPTKPVLQLLEKLKNGSHVEPPKDEPLKVRASTKNYMERRADILGILDNYHLKASEICLAMNIDASQCRRLLMAMHKDGLLEYIEHHLQYRIWYIKGQLKPDIDDNAKYRKLRAEAKELGLVTYLGKPCDKCGGTEIYTGANKCKPCLVIYRKNYLKDY